MLPLRRHPRTAASLAVLAVLVPSTAGHAGDMADAAEPGLDASAIPIILVTANREQTFDVGGSVHRLDAKDLAVFAQADVNRVLRVIPGLVLQEEEGFGLRPNIGIRGSGSDRSARVAIMEDGVLVAPAPYAAPAAYYFPRLARISAVEVAKGPAAIKYGPLTVGGAVTFLSTPIPERDGQLGGHADLLGGTFGTLRAHGNLGGWFPVSQGLEAGVLVEGLWERSDGFKRLDGPGGDTGYDITDMVLKAGLRTADGRHDVQLRFQRFQETSDETYLGLTRADFLSDPRRRYVGSQVDQMNVRQDFWQLSYRFAPTDRFELAAIGYIRDTSRAWYKLQDVRNAADTGWSSLSNILLRPASFATELADIRGTTGFVGRTGALRVRNNNRVYDARGAQLVAVTRFATGGLSHRLEASVRYHEDSEDRFQQDDRYTNVNGTLQLAMPGAPGSQDNRIGEARAWSFYVRDTIEAGPLSLTPGLRYERIRLRQTRWAANDPGRVAPTQQTDTGVDVWIPGVGATVDLGHGFRLVGGAHRGFRNPAPGATASAETSWNYEAGLRYGTPRAGVEVMGFLNAYDNLVGVCTASTGGGCDIGQEFDGGKARVAGVEVTAQTRLAGLETHGFALPVMLVYTLLDSRFQSSFTSGFGPWGTVNAGDSFPYAPRHQLSFALG
ncbi:MAG: TonB-dependent receptor family protein, partial [Thermaurantiacus sp.]